MIARGLRKGAQEDADQRWPARLRSDKGTDVDMFGEVEERGLSAEHGLGRLELRREQLRWSRRWDEGGGVDKEKEGAEKEIKQKAERLVEGGWHGRWTKQGQRCDRA